MYYFSLEKKSKESEMLTMLIYYSKTPCFIFLKSTLISIDNLISRELYSLVVYTHALTTKVN